MLRNAPKILLFDLGGVLVENSTFQDLRSLLPEPLALSVIKDRWLVSKSVCAFETGVIGANEFSIRFCEEWSLAITPKMLIAYFEQWPKGPFVGAVERLQTLRFTFKTAILSNCNALHWPHMRALTDSVDHAFSSHLIGFAKPHRSAFEHACRSMSCRANDILFFDDSLTNVQAAKEAGLNAVHADGFAMLEEQLSNHVL